MDKALSIWASSVSQDVGWVAGSGSGASIGLGFRVKALGSSLNPEP